MSRRDLDDYLRDNRGLVKHERRGKLHIVEGDGWSESDEDPDELAKRLFARPRSYDKPKPKKKGKVKTENG